MKKLFWTVDEPVVSVSCIVITTRDYDNWSAGYDKHGYHYVNWRRTQTSGSDLWVTDKSVGKKRPVQTDQKSIIAVNGEKILIISYKSKAAT